MKFSAFFGLCLTGFATILSADIYHSVKVSELNFGEESESAQKAMKVLRASGRFQVPLNVRCAAELYAGIQADEGGERGRVTQGDFEIVFQLADEQAISGFVDLLEINDYTVHRNPKAFAFTFVPGEKTRSTKERFELVRSSFARKLALSHAPGTAWFRYLTGPEETRPGRQWRPSSDLSDSFALFSGGRAISENLALDRELILAEDKEGKTVPLSEIKGVTVKAIDWSSRLPEGEVMVDSLSLALPENQHAVFVKSMPDLLALIDRAERELIPASQAYSVRNPFRKMAKRYQK